MSNKPKILDGSYFDFYSQLNYPDLVLFVCWPFEPNLLGRDLNEFKKYNSFEKLEFGVGTRNLIWQFVV